MPLATNELVEALNKLLDRLGYGGLTRVEEAAGIKSLSVGRISRGEVEPSLNSWEAIYKAFPNDIPPPRLVPVIGEDATAGNVQRGACPTPLEELEYEEIEPLILVLRNKGRRRATKALANYVIELCREEMEAVNSLGMQGVNTA